MDYPWTFQQFLYWQNRNKALKCCHREDNDRPPLVIQPIDKEAALKSFPKTGMSTFGVKCSLPQELMEKVSDTKAD